MNEWSMLAIGLALTVGTGLFVASEFALVNLDRNELEARQQRGEKRLGPTISALKITSTHLSSAQLGITLTTLLTGYTFEPAVSSLLRDPLGAAGLPDGAVTGVGAVIGVLLATLFSMIIGELVPKNFALALPLATAKIVVPFQIAFTTVLKPLILFFNNTANAVIRSLGIEPKEELSGARTAEELSSLVRRSAMAGVLDEDHATLLGRTLRFSQRSAADVLTPRVRMVTVDIDATAEDVIKVAGTSGFSRFPVIGKDSDDVRGVVHVKQAFAVPLADQATVLVSDLLTSALRVPQSMGVDSLLGVLRTQSYQIAIVLDEFGGTEGVVTLEDLVEELVGELEDEYDRPRSEVRRTGRSVVFDAALRPDEVLDRAGVRVPEGEDYDTVGGFVTDCLDRVAELGDEVPTPDGTLRVERVSGGRVERLRFIPDEVQADLVPAGTHDQIVEQLREDLS